MVSLETMVWYCLLIGTRYSQQPQLYFVLLVLQACGNKPMCSKIITIHHVCTSWHGNPSNSCCDISLKNKEVNLMVVKVSVYWIIWSGTCTKCCPSHHILYVCATSCKSIACGCTILRERQIHKKIVDEKNKEMYSSRTLRHLGKIVAEPSHLGYKTFETLPSGRRLRPKPHATRTLSSHLQLASLIRSGTSTTPT